MCSLWQGLSNGTINFEHVTLTVTFDLLFKHFNIAPGNLHNALRGPSWLCQYSSYLNDAGGAWRLTGFDTILARQIGQIWTGCKYKQIFFAQTNPDANRCRRVSKPPRIVNWTEAIVLRYTVKRYIVSPLIPGFKVKRKFLSWIILGILLVITISDFTCK